jgi:hypothetical protein
MSHTYALLALSPAAFEEIRALLEAGGYTDQFHAGDSGLVIDLHGLAAQASPHELQTYACVVCAEAVIQDAAWHCGCDGETIREADYQEGRPIPPTWVEA